MRIITINVPDAYLEVLDTISGEGKAYASRSEAVRHAIKDFVIKEMQIAKGMGDIYQISALSSKAMKTIDDVDLHVKYLTDLVKAMNPELMQKNPMLNRVCSEPQMLVENNFQ